MDKFPAAAQPGLFPKDCELWEQAPPAILFPNLIDTDTPSPHNVSDLVLNNPFFSLKF